MYSRWIEMELYRLNCVRSWPESPYKTATLKGILDSLKRLGYTLKPVPGPGVAIPAAALKKASRRAA